MARPSSHDDLHNYDRATINVGSFNVDRVATQPGALAAYGEFLDRLLASGEFTIDECGNVTCKPPTAELDRKLANKQRDWDRGEELWAEWIDNGTYPDTPYLWSAYLAAEGLTAPAKPEADK